MLNLSHYTLKIETVNKNGTKNIGLTSWDGNKKTLHVYIYNLGRYIQFNGIYLSNINF